MARGRCVARTFRLLVPTDPAIPPLNLTRKQRRLKKIEDFTNYFFNVVD